MLPDISVLWVILAVLVLAIALDRLLFKPLLRVMSERETAVKSAMDMAQQATAKAQAATDEFDTKLGAARAELYKQMDERRTAAEAYRADLMTKTRSEVDASLASAKAQLEAQATAARVQLEQSADSLGKEIAQKVLGRTGAAILLVLLLSGGAMAQHAAAPEPSAPPAVGQAPQHATPESATPVTAPGTEQAGAHAVPNHGADQGTPEHGAPAAHESGHAEEHGTSYVQMAAKLFNFAILVGTLYYFLKSPFLAYLAGRKSQIRADLEKAADMKTSAAAQMAAVETKLAALPAELEALRKTGAAEVSAEEARIREMAEVERVRLLEQMNREVELHTRAAERDLTRLAATRAVAAATAEIEKTMTSADHARLQDRYVAMVSQ